jgi:tRNA dimethylallyltransferase
MTLDRPPVVAIVGPTASGKSDLAVHLALEFGGEVINADSMQLYRGMDIGTAKITVTERSGVPHHLFDIWSVTEAANVATYQQLTRESIAQIQQRGKLPILVGGSGLYVRAAVDELAFPGTDPDVRRKWEEQLELHGPLALHARLSELDPRSAAAILPTNGRRLVRALEVIELTGQDFIATLPDPTYVVPTVQIGLDVPREVLDQRIDLRVDRMWEQGLVDEVRALDVQGLRDGVTASRALGYSQALKFIDGEWTPEQAVEDTKRTTRRFARRQDTWFRRDQRITWVPLDTPDLVARARSIIEDFEPRRV